MHISNLESLGYQLYIGNALYSSGCKCNVDNIRKRNIRINLVVDRSQKAALTIAYAYDNGRIWQQQRVGTIDDILKFEKEFLIR